MLELLFKLETYFLKNAHTNFRGNLFQKQERYYESLRAYDAAITFRPRLAGNICQIID